MARTGVLFVLLSLSLFLLFPTEVVHAGEIWCADDPLVSIGGRLLDIQVQMPVAHLLTLRTTTLTVIIPQNLTGTVLVDDVSAFPMRTTIAPTGALWDGSSPIDVRVVVDVTAALDYPVQVVATPLLTLSTPLAASTIGTGTANTRLVVPLVLGH